MADVGIAGTEADGLLLERDRLPGSTRGAQELTFGKMRKRLAGRCDRSVQQGLAATKLAAVFSGTSTSRSGTGRIIRCRRFGRARTLGQRGCGSRAAPYNLTLSTYS
jgi:hypothetical protein